MTAVISCHIETSRLISVNVNNLIDTRIARPEYQLAAFNEQIVR